MALNSWLVLPVASSSFKFAEECVFLTQWDLLSGVSGQKEDEQGQSGDEDTRDEQVEAVEKSPSPHHHGVGDVRVRLQTAIVYTLVLLSGNLCETKK